ncbi:ATP-dependent DNA ligase [Acidisarcina polymorpha]|uniref:ATP-dependent DNA ligase n=1 Tax=Acidisarcina polymorpha TaxID=2211140 RepID=UPI001F185B8C|nr:ATP-dependent DNA ligase [Acidisarcina polymorpha]
MAATFLEFAQLCDALASTTKKLEKRAQIADWLKTLSVEDAARGSLYLAGQAFAETDPRVLNLGGAILSKALAEESGASEAAMHEAYRRHGDLGAAAADLLLRQAGKPVTLTLAQVEERFSQIASAKGPSAKLPVILELLRAATPLEAKYLIKLALGDMRTGVKQSLVEEAIAAAFGAEASAIRQATMLKGSLPEVVRLAAAGRLQEARMSLFHPLGFMLASPVDSVDEAVARFAVEVAAEATGNQLSVDEAGSSSKLDLSFIETEVAQSVLKEAQVEDKYDGIRAQLHCGDPEQPGRVALFSRSRDNMTAAFPELIEAFASLHLPVILDGEILAWDVANSRALPFSLLQKRIGRKKVTDEMREQTPIIFMAFDLLYLDGELMLERPLSARRKILEEFARNHTDSVRAGFREAHTARSQGSLFSEEIADGPSRLVLAPAIVLSSAEQLDQAYMDARNRGNEGVMIKSLASIYQPGRRGLAWLKLKRELATLDVVVTAAEFGHGRRAGILSDYTFAVRDGEQLRNVGKAYSGLTDSEIAELSQFFKDHTVEDFGYVRSVEPVLVLEVAFNNVTRSDRHASGFALRFPRILRIRQDKPVAEIDSLARVEEIYASQPELIRNEELSQ